MKFTLDQYQILSNLVADELDTQKRSRDKVQGAINELYSTGEYDLRGRRRDEEDLKKYYGLKAQLEGLEDYVATLESMMRTFNDIKF